MIFLFWRFSFFAPFSGAGKRDDLKISIIDYMNKKVVTPPVFLDRDKVYQEVLLPQGDYFGRNYLKNR